MATRDILNYEGSVIGQLSEPDGVTWSEEIWAEKLAPFAQAPTSNPYYQIEVTVKQRREIAEELMQKWKKENIVGSINIAQAMWLHHRLRALNVTLPAELGGLSFTLDLMNLVVSGDLEVAQLAIKYSTADDMTMPYHWISAERKAQWISDLSQYTGIAP